MYEEFPFSAFGENPQAGLLMDQVNSNVFDQPVVAVHVGLMDPGIVYFEFSSQPSANDSAMLSAIVSAHAFIGARNRKIISIDDRTKAIIDGGFTYAGKIFSLSLPAQSKLTAAFNLRDHPMFTFPVEWNNIDDTGTLIVATKEDMEAFYLTAIGMIRAILTSDTDLKKMVRAATTISEVEAVTDPR